MNCVPYKAFTQFCFLFGGLYVNIIEYFSPASSSARITELTITPTSSAERNSASSSIHSIAIGLSADLILLILMASSAPLNNILVPVGIYRRDNGETRSSQCASTPRILMALLSCAYTESLSVAPTFRTTSASTPFLISSVTIHKAAVVDLPEARPPLSTTVVYLSSARHGS